ncbi:hypothetical protein NX059_010314 [Plenodomus lindquistii]|nr:hypothetical protein NX059_010314 [Plenodomus lindquistii]
MSDYTAHLEAATAAVVAPAVSSTQTDTSIGLEDPDSKQHVCYLHQCPMELLILIATHLDTAGLCALSRVSKRCQEAAQDVLYRKADLRSSKRAGEPTETKISKFLWTICTKPYLGGKALQIKWLPSKHQILIQKEPLSIVGTGPFRLDNIIGVTVCEQHLAGNILSRLPNLECIQFGGGNYTNGTHFSRAFPKAMLLLLDALATVPGLAKIERIFVSYRCLNWAALTLKTLRSLYLGRKGSVDIPADGASAGNITKFGLDLWQPLNTKRSSCISIREVTDLLAHFPKLEELRLRSMRNSRRENDSFGAFGNLVIDLDMRNLPFQAYQVSQLNICKYTNLVSIWIPEDALINKPGLHGVPYIFPAMILPHTIDEVIVTYPDARISDTRLLASGSRALGWFELFSKDDFPHLKRIGVECSDGFGDLSQITCAFRNLKLISSLKAKGVEVWLTAGSTKA